MIQHGHFLIRTDSEPKRHKIGSRGRGRLKGLRESGRIFIPSGMDTITRKHWVIM